MNTRKFKGQVKVYLNTKPHFASYTVEAEETHDAIRQIYANAKRENPAASKLVVTKVTEIK